MLIIEFARQPGVGRLYVQPELFMQLALEGIARSFAGLDLAAGKLPIARVNFACRTLGKKKLATSVFDHGGSHFYALARRHDFNASPIYLPRAACARPAQSRANCHATRPLREPRCKAHCSAA